MRSVVVIVGPTGSGKSDLALDLAKSFHGEIVNCDSVQLYRYMDIGTAKTPPEERRNIPHHLIDILNPNEVFTAGDYQRVARTTLEQITARGRLPIVVGGTGFYLRALLHGLFEGPRRDEELRTRLASRKPGSLYRILTRLDPEAAARIHPKDTQKLIRAVEVFVLTRRPITALFDYNREPLQGFRIIQLGLDPDRRLLAERINQRCIRMFEHGLLDETRRLLDRGYPPNTKALQSIGYREAVELLAGTLTLPEAIERTQAATRQYAKRQRTWFRRDATITWYPGFGNQSETCEAAKGHVAKALNT